VWSGCEKYFGGFGGEEEGRPRKSFMRMWICAVSWDVLIVIEVGVLTWTSVWLSYVEPAVTLRMKNLESIICELEGERGGVWVECLSEE